MSTPTNDERPFDLSDEEIEEINALFKQSKGYRIYDLVLVNGEPQFVLSEFDQMFERVLDEVYGKKEEDA